MEKVNQVTCICNLQFHRAEAECKFSVIVMDFSPKAPQLVENANKINHLSEFI